MDCYNIFGHLGMYQKLRKFISVYQTNIQKETIKESRHSEDTPSNNQAIWFTKSLLDQNSMTIPTTKPYMNLFFLSPFFFYNNFVFAYNIFQIKKNPFHNSTRPSDNAE